MFMDELKLLQLQQVHDIRPLQQVIWMTEAHCNKVSNERFWVCLQNLHKVSGFILCIVPTIFLDEDLNKSSVLGNYAERKTV